MKANAARSRHPHQATPSPFATLNEPEPPLHASDAPEVPSVPSAIGGWSSSACPPIPPIKVTDEQSSSFRAPSARRRNPLRFQSSDEDSDDVVADKVKKRGDGGDKSTDSGNGSDRKRGEVNSDDEDDDGDDDDHGDVDDDNYGGDDDDDNYGGDKELNLDDDESEDEYEDEEEEKDELMPDDTPPKAPVSHRFLILALLSDLRKPLVRARRETRGPRGKQVAKDVAAPRFSVGRKRKHSSPTALSRKRRTQPIQIEGLHLSLHSLSEGSDDSHCIFPEDFVGAVRSFFFQSPQQGS